MLRLRTFALTFTAMLVALALANPAWGHGGSKEPPKRVLVIILDQLRPDYVDEFDMRHVKASQDEPQYLVKSDKTGKEAVHKPGALTEES